jgi:membrane protein implicated in regulation of membrane protease activity
MAWNESSMGTIVTDRVGIDAVVVDCERYWLAAGIKRRIARDMRQELEQHLVEATADGRTPESVVGPDIAGFARDWAAAQRPGSEDGLPSWEDALRRRRRRFSWSDVAILLVVAGAAVAALAAAGEGGESTMDNETWRWIWLFGALFLGLAEVVTAGFFMLPFAAGAVVAAILAFAGVDPAIQLIVFIASSSIALIVLQRFVRREDEHQPAMGSNRFVGSRAMVIEPIDPMAGGGRVKMETEVWRATTDGGPIDEGTPVVVVDVRGARLVVEPAE